MSSDDSQASQARRASQVAESLTTQEKVNRLVECLKETNLKDVETCQKAFNNLSVLARDSSPQVVFDHPDCLAITLEGLDTYKKDPSGVIVLKACFSLLSGLSKMSVERTRKILEKFPIDYLTDIICYSNNNELLTAFQSLIQTFLNTFAGVQEMRIKNSNQSKLDKERTLSVAEAISTRAPKKVDDERIKANDDLIYEIFVRLVRRASSYIISAASRDCLLALVMSNIEYDGLNYGVKLVEAGCIDNLLDIASEVEELKSSSSMELTSMTHSLVAAVLEKIYSCHDSDKVREVFRERCQNYLNKRLHNPDIDDKVRTAKLFTVLLAGPVDIGNSCVGQTGMIEMILAMANSDELSQQKAALDAIIAAASKKDKCTAIANLGKEVLNRLRESKNEEIRIKALVGLSKVGSVGSTDASIRPFSRDANPSFARDCRAIISRPTPEFTLKKHAIEALAYLSFDGDVKEELVEDEKALNSLFEILEFDMNSPVVYSILNIFVNLTNSYDKQEHSPELLQLAQFAQQHIPEQHTKDKKEFLERRLIRLSQSNLVPALIRKSNVAKESDAVKELISRILNALCEIECNRGRLVQQGAVKLLISITQTDNNKKTPDKYYLLAAQALARLGITIDPRVVFPDQRHISVIRPIKKLLSPDCDALQNFEGLMALTNLAQVGDSACTHILHESGFALIEAHMFEEHVMIRRAAVQCVANLIRYPQMVALYEGENDRVKYLMILCEEEDIETVKAASGALAMLCQVSDKACEKVFTAQQWHEILFVLVTNENPELVHRALVLISSLIHCEDSKLSKNVFESNLLEALIGIRMAENQQDFIKGLANSMLDFGREKNLIPNDRLRYLT